jgi:DNA-binding MarR family transcriptional regulator
MALWSGWSILLIEPLEFQTGQANIARFLNLISILTPPLNGPYTRAMARKTSITDSPEQLSFEPDEQHLYDTLAQTHDLLSAAFNQMFQGYDLTHTQFMVMKVIQAAGKDGIATQKIGQRILTRVPDVTRILDRLVRNGLVQRNRSKEDKRVLFVSLTDEGTTIMNELVEPVDELRSSLFAHMSVAKQTQLNDLLLESQQGTNLD